MEADLLPFLKNKQHGEAGLSIKVRAPDEQDTQENSNDNEGLEAAASDIISAVHMKDHKALATALKAAYDMCESAPTEMNETDEKDEE